MRFLVYRAGGREALAVANDSGAWRGLDARDPQFPGPLGRLLLGGEVALRDGFERITRHGVEIDPTTVAHLPPFPQPPKILCIGLNYADHTKESAMAQPDKPTVFARFASSLIGHGAPIVRPRASMQLDYEGELVAVIGRGGRHIAREAALEHVAGWSLFNDASVRDFQFSSPQWTLGKNFDATGAFGPVFVTADELPAGARGLTLETRLNGEVVQRASTDDMIFDVATLIAILSETMTLEVGDIIVTGTPAGVGMARTPPLWMKPGDVVEVEVAGLGMLVNPIAAE